MVLGLFYILQNTVYAKDISFDFVRDNGKKRTKVLVAEFLDRSSKSTSVGKSLNYFIHHEILSSIGYHAYVDINLLSVSEEKRIHDLARTRYKITEEILGTLGSEVLSEDIKEKLIPLLNQKPLERRGFVRALRKVLKNDEYRQLSSTILKNSEMKSKHNLALDILKDYQGSMIFWGEINIDNRNYGSVVNVDAFLTVNPQGPSRKVFLQSTNGSQQKPYMFEAELTNTTFTFEQVDVLLDQLYARKLVTLTPAALRSKPRVGSDVVRRVLAGIILESDDRRDSWFRVFLEKGKHAYIDSRQVSIAPEEGNLGLPTFTLPAQYFILGMTHYQLNHFDQAYQAFSEFIRHSINREKNENLLSAYLWQGTSLLLSPSSNHDEEIGLQPFEEALNYTLGSRDLHNLRALGRLGISRPLNLGDVLADLNQTIKLESRDVTARQILRKLDQIDKAHDKITLPTNIEWVNAIIGIENILDNCPLRLLNQAFESDDFNIVNKESRCPILLPKELNEVKGELSSDIGIKCSKLMPADAANLDLEKDKLNVNMITMNQTPYKLFFYLHGKSKSSQLSSNIEISPGTCHEIMLIAGDYEFAMELMPDPELRLSKIRSRYGRQTGALGDSYAFNFRF